MRAGTLTGNDALDVAVRIRTDKHIDPVLGALAAYLYDAVGDRDNIRRIAYFYASAGETVPFDVALLADLRGTIHDGRLVVDVPAVPARTPLPPVAMTSFEFEIRKPPPALGADTEAVFAEWLKPTG